MSNAVRWKCDKDEGIGFGDITHTPELDAIIKHEHYCGCDSNVRLTQVDPDEAVHVIATTGVMDVRVFDVKGRFVVLAGETWLAPHRVEKVLDTLPKYLHQPALEAVEWISRHQT